MLVLSARVGERVLIPIGGGREIMVQVVEIDKLRGAVLGFEAPDDVPVYRQKVYDRLVAEGRDLMRRPGDRGPDPERRVRP